MNQSVIERPSSDPIFCFKCGAWPATVSVSHKKRQCEDCARGKN